MNKLLYILFLLFCSIAFCNGQYTKTVIVKTEKPNAVYEKFLVLKSNPHIKHGPYLKKKKNVLIKKGFYKYNQPDSLWEYCSLKGKLIAKGYYDNGSKKGIWNYYSFNGNLLQKYNHTSDSLLYYDTLEEKKQYPYLNFKTSANSQMAWVIGGYSNLYNTIACEIIFPKEMLDKEQTVTIKVYLVVDTFGNTTQVTLQKVQNTTFETEAIRVVNLLGKFWMPAIIENKKVKMSYIFPVKFSIE